MSSERPPSQRAEVRRDECAGCRGPKPAGRGRKFCDECRDERVRWHAPGHQPQPCKRCGGPKPPGRGRILCDACAVVERSGPKVPRRRAVRVIVDDFGDAQRWRRCSDCTSWKPQDGDHFSPRRRAPSGHVLRFDSLCKPCRAVRNGCHQRAKPLEAQRAERRAKEARIRADPERAARARERKRLASKRLRERDRDRARAASRRYYERLRADPVRWAAYLDRARMNHRLRMERAGTPVTRSSARAVGAFRESSGKLAQREGHPVEPLGLWLDAVMAEDSRDVGELATLMGAHERQVLSLRSRQYPTVALATADRLVWNYGRPVRLPSAETIERMLETRYRAMPGNGERILRYIDAAEQVGHLAGTVVDRVEDLWPELAEVGALR